MRHRNKAVRAFFADYRHYREMAELHQALGDVTKALGFCYFALLHHAHPAQSNSLLVHLHNYPPDWASRYVEEQLYRNDPVLEACSRTNVGFSWDEIDTLIRMTPRLRFTIDSAQESGLGNGFTVPAHVPGEPLGSCSFVTAAGVALPRDSLHIAELVGSFAFAAARRINWSGINGQRGYAALTPRQRDCVYWLSQGKEHAVPSSLRNPVQVAGSCVRRPFCKDAKACNYGIANCGQHKRGGETPGFICDDSR